MVRLAFDTAVLHLRFGFQHSGDRDADEDMNVDLLQVPSKAVWMAFSAFIDVYSKSSGCSLNVEI